MSLFGAHREAGTEILPSEGRLPPFEGATGWLNSEPLTPEGLRGRVVAVQFWTYTCVNWLRTLPYVREWAAKYHDQGLSVIGVHTPEFGFERNVENVVAAARDMRVDYPIALDSDYAIWSAFANHFWPALYIADEQGRIRYHHFGEGEYAMSEMVIQQLLGEAGKEGFDPTLVSVEPKGTEVEADWSNLRTPETCLSYGRSYSFASADGKRIDEPHDYPELSSQLSLNQWTPSGVRTLADHAAVLYEAPGRIAIRFHARDVNLVMGSATRGTSVPFRVLIDGEAPGAAHGEDVDEQGKGTVREQQLYQLIRQRKPIADRLFEIEFLDTGVEAYCFTFG
ncbi:MAG: redoxin family protein [Actinomycetota bacterium]|nr:redoxin family protein [Actinomycetota bacterium]